MEALSQVKNLEKNRIDFFVESSRRQAPCRNKIILVQGVLKGNRSDWLVEKAAELGIGSIYFTKMEYSVCSEADIRKRIPRWERLSCSALKQSGQLFLPEIRAFASLEQSIEGIEPKAIILYFHSQGILQ